VTLLLDTGPVVAAIDRPGNYHGHCTALLESAQGPLGTQLIPATVIVEGCWLVEEAPTTRMASTADRHPTLPMSGHCRAA